MTFNCLSNHSHKVQDRGIASQSSVYLSCSTTMKQGPCFFCVSFSLESDSNISVVNTLWSKENKCYVF